MTFLLAKGQRWHEPHFGEIELTRRVIRDSQQPSEIDVLWYWRTDDFRYGAIPEVVLLRDAVPAA